MEQGKVMPDESYNPSYMALMPGVTDFANDFSLP